MNKITWSIFIIAVVGLLTGLIIFSHKSDIDVSKIDTSAIQKGTDQDGNIADHVYGNKNSSVTIINYGDFECSGCGSAHPEVKAIMEEYKDQIRYVFRNFPLTSSHPNAKAAASAAEAAGLQGKYWDMYNKLYENQSEWSTLTGEARTDQFVSYAKGLGLNTSKFTTDMSSSEVEQKIEFDFDLGTKDKVSETPTFILNGKKVDSATWGDSTKFKALINKKLKAAGIALPAGEE